MLPNTVLFEGADSSGRTDLWETNGTAVGTFELTGVAGAPSTGLYPSDLTNYNGEVLFTSFDASGADGLWVTDGTAAGTHELAVAGALARTQYPFLAGLNPPTLRFIMATCFSLASIRAASSSYGRRMERPPERRNWP
jgi:hypothetical protein